MSLTSSSAASTSDRLTTVLSYGALLLLIYLVFRIVEPFLVPLAWSAVLAVFFHGVHEWIARRLGPNRAALVSTLGVTLLLIAPALVVLFYTARQAIDATAQLQSALMDPNKALQSHAVAWIQRHLPQAWQAADFSQPLRQGAERIATFLGSRLAGLVRNLFTFFVDLFIVIFALFFMFRDGEEIVRGASHLLPFDEPFTIGGISTPIFWAVLIAFFSLVPVVGSALIWVPGALYLGFSGHWGKGLVVVVICGGVAGLADNIVRPLLLRNRTHLNELLLFLGVLGGLEVFGLLGLVIGPTILAAAMGVFRVYVEHRDGEAARAV